MSTRPQVAKEFNDAMALHSNYIFKPWVDIYPSDTIITNARAGCPMVVDVGGGKGHDLEKFRIRHRNNGVIPDGALVLQERPDVAEKLVGVDRDPAIMVQAYDFFTPQPARGARVYLLHSILHDWHDEDAVKVLINVAGAMEKGYSRLLIHESLVSTVKPHRRLTTTDLVMMALFAAKERTEEEFKKLVVSAGLKVCKIWRPPQSVESIIEAELA
ncbi:hypothetical protein PG995_000316 [Apiospora arundinis]